MTNKFIKYYRFFHKCIVGIMLFLGFLTLSCSSSNKEMQKPQHEPVYTQPALEEQTTSYPTETNHVPETIISVKESHKVEQPGPQRPPVNSIKTSQYYEEGYEKGYDDGEDDAVMDNGWGGQFNDQCRYQGKKKKDYQLGYEEGYEAGYYDNKDTDE